MGHYGGIIVSFSCNDRASTQLNRMLGSCLGRKGGVVLIDGTVASGKTELLRKLSEQAIDSGAIVLSALAVQTEKDIPFGVVDQLAHNASVQFGEIAELQETIAAGARVAAAPGADPERVNPEHGRVLAQLHGAMMRLVARGPLVIMVDDLHHADQVSLQFLCYLARRILNKRVLLVCGVLPGAVPTFPLFQMEMLSQTNCQRVVLEPLSARQVGDVLRECADGAEAARLAPLYQRLSGGNPLLVNALVADRVAAAGGLPAEGGLPNYRRAVLTCLQRMDRVSAEVAQGLSVLEATGSRHLVDRLLRLDSVLVRRSQHILVRSGLLTAQGYRHREGRAAALESLAAGRRAELHTEAARLLFQEGAGVAEVGTHLLAADSAKDPWAVPLLIEAAEQQLRANQLDRATAYVRLAQREAVTEEQYADVTLMLARTEWRLNPAVVARHLGPRPGFNSEPPLQSRQAVQMIRELLEQGLLEQAKEALRWAGESGFDAQHADCDEWNAFKIWLACTYPPLAFQLAGMPEQAGPYEQSGRSQPTGDLARSAHLLGTVLRGDLTNSGLELAEDRLRTLQLNERTFEALGITLQALVYADQYELAYDWGRVLFKEANDRNVLAWVALFASVMAEVMIGRGDPTAAAEYARTAMSCRPYRIGTARPGNPLATLVLALVESGDLESAGLLLSQAASNEAPHGREDLYFLHARGHHHLAVHQPHQALQDFEACGRRMSAWKLDSPSFIPWRTDRAQALIALHRYEEARRLAGEQLAELDPLQHRTRAMTLRVLAEATEPEQRPALLEEALHVTREAPDHVETSRILDLLGRTRQSLGDAVTATSVPRQSRNGARSRDGERLLPGQGAGGTASRDEARGIADLSAAEQRVAFLVGKGRTNSEVAGELFITVSTVEQHLTRIYRKLGIKQRGDLRARLVGSHA
ncbi:AAA family ATPase [Streptomyces sp. NPDC017413]|uniref:AAA family ATPase n=1 Tax=Streptomyces sp. NPDC017413 TaxID=3364994 RepID=UPI00379BC0C0